MFHSTTIEVTRTGAGCGLTVWCNSKLITGYVVQRSACLSELDIGSTDIPIPPAAFWDWVEYSPSDNASKGVLELCCLLEVRARSFAESQDHALCAVLPMERRRMP